MASTRRASCTWSISTRSVRVRMPEPNLRMTRLPMRERGTSSWRSSGALQAGRGKLRYWGGRWRAFYRHASKADDVQITLGSETCQGVTVLCRHVGVHRLDVPSHDRVIGEER